MKKGAEENEEQESGQAFISLKQEEGNKKMSGGLLLLYIPCLHSDVHDSDSEVRKDDGQGITYGIGQGCHSQGLLYILGYVYIPIVQCIDL